MYLCVLLQYSNRSCIRDYITANTKIKYFESKQFGFQSGHSTDDAIIQLVDQIYDNFEENKCKFNIFERMSEQFLPQLLFRNAN